MENTAVSLNGIGILQGHICAARIESSTPAAYRLKRIMSTGELILQGCFTWRQGCNGGFDWKDIPTVEEEI